MGHLALRTWDEAKVSGYTHSQCVLVLEQESVHARSCMKPHVRLHNVYLYAHVAMYSLRALYVTIYHVYVTSVSHNAPHILSVIGPRVWGLYGQTIW